MENQDSGRTNGADDASANQPENERGDRQRITAVVKSQEDRSNSQSDVTSGSRWPGVRHVVPITRRRVLSWDAPVRPARPHVTGEGLAEISFRAVPDRREVGIIGTKRPLPQELGKQSRRGRYVRLRTALSAAHQSNSAAPSGKKIATSVAPDVRERGVQGSRWQQIGSSRRKERIVLGATWPGFEAMDVALALRKNLEAGKAREVKARAITRAKADVVSILLSEINQAPKSPSDVMEQVPQDGIVRAAWQRQAERRRHAQRQTQVTTATERVEVGCRCVDLRSRANFRLYVVFPAMFEGLVESWIDCF